MIRRILGVALLCLLVLLSCKKQDVSRQQQQQPQVAKPDFIELSPAEEQEHMRAGSASRTGQIQSGDTVIFVDWDGQTVSGTSWNVSGPIYAQASHMSSFGKQQVMSMVAERYSTFHVTITTDSTVYWAATPTRRMRCIVTPTSSWYGTGAGGVAFVHSFIWGDNTPCFIFDSLLNENTKNVAIAITHEAGHTLGLSHQGIWDSSCNLVNAYNPGYGTGATSWAPTMGSAYSKSLWTFTIGHDTRPGSCTVLTNEYAVIDTAFNGSGIQLSNKPDVVDNTLNPDGYYLFKNTPVTQSLEYPTDVDFYKIHMEGQLTNYITVQTYGTTDIAVDVYDTNGNYVGSLDPSGSADIPRTGVGGPIQNYVAGYIAIRNTVNNPNVPPGSLRGSYTITLDWVALQ